ncbi:Sec-independent protein translocase protein TatA OS=Lysinibacillus sphaericus OX=1421 GN=tatA PE=3 SV=1 [Lysinibacillus sphaericus]
MVVHLSAITPVGLVIIGVVAILIFGPKKLPELGKAMGLRFFANLKMQRKGAS